MRTLAALCTLVVLAACATAPAAPPSPAPGPAAAGPAPFESRYQPFPSVPTLVRGGTVMTAAGEVIENGDVLLVDGRVEAVGTGLEAPAGARVIEARGRYVTPGIIDTHSHLGVYASPGDAAHADGNEMTRPVTGHVWAEHAIWPQDPGFARAIAGGITSLHILPGSANLIGGRGVTLRNAPARTVQAMKFPGAPHTLKMACGENPKRVYGSRNQAPMTRMANIALTREAWIRAAEYRDQWDRWENGGRSGQAPTRNLELETLAGVLRGEILIQNHCYRADEIANRLEIAREFGYTIRSIHHGVEAYKVADMLAEEGVGVSIWADWWGFKLEALDATNANAALTHRAGVTTVIHSDDAIGIQLLNQEAAKALAAGREAGIEISDDEALRWITANAAWTLGIDQETGTLVPGKRADLVVWSAHPFSVYARADQVFVDGALLYDRFDPARNPVTDFELGIFSGEGF